MKYREKEIKDLTYDELVDASFELNRQKEVYEEKLNHPKLQKLKPTVVISNSFLELLNEINSEIGQRNG